MIGYATIGTNDLERAKGFYDAILEPLGGRRTMELGGRMQFWGGDGQSMLAVCTPYDGSPASVGNGSMFGLPAPDRSAADAVYARALEAGGSCEGATGERLPGYYVAYFRDLDGNKLCVFHAG